MKTCFLASTALHLADMVEREKKARLIAHLKQGGDFLHPSRPAFEV